MNRKPEIHLFTDGACSGNGSSDAVGGWAYYAYCVMKDGRRVERENSGHAKSDDQNKVTNNQMELQAVIEGLSIIKKPSTIHIYTDSRYIADCFKKKWYVGWSKNGWKNSKKEPVANRKLWEELLDLVFEKGHSVEWIWVKGHAGNEYNERVDQMAVSARNAVS